MTMRRCITHKLLCWTQNLVSATEFDIRHEAQCLLWMLELYMGYVIGLPGIQLAPKVLLTQILYAGSGKSSLMYKLVLAVVCGSSCSAR